MTLAQIRAKAMLEQGQLLLQVAKASGEVIERPDGNAEAATISILTFALAMAVADAIGVDPSEQRYRQGLAIATSQLQEHIHLQHRTRQGRSTRQ